MAQKTSILYVNASFGGGGGSDTVVLNSARLLDREKFDVAVAYLRKPDRTLAPILERLKVLGLEYYELPGRVFDLHQLKRLVSIMDERGVHIYHSHEFKSNVYGALIKRARKDVIYVSTAHGWNPTSLKVAAYMRLDKFALKSFDKVIAVSSDLERIARSYGIKRTCVMLNAVDADKWSSGKGARRGDGDGGSGAKKPFTLGYVGRLSKEKGPLDFLRVGAGVIRRVKEPVELIMAGAGPEQEAVEAEAKRLGIAESVKFLGQVGERDLAKLYQGLDILLLPSYTEGVPMTILEAGAAKVPVVATRVGGVGEVITHGENGLLSTAGDVEAMVLNVIKLHDDPSLAKKVSLAGRENVVERFSIQKRMRELERLYLDLVEERGKKRA